MSQHQSHDDRRRERRKAHMNARLSSGIDIGHHPPLDPDGQREPEIDRREINLRWLGASILTGLTGAALIGASIHIALEGSTTSVAPPERAILRKATASPEAEHAASELPKGDKLVHAETSTSAKQSFRAPMTIRNGDREAIKVRHFVHVATNLSLTTGAYASDIPPFNPMRLFSEDSDDHGTDQVPQPDELSNADVAVIHSDLAAISVEPSAPALSDDDTLSILAEESQASSDASSPSPPVPVPAQQMLSRTLKAPDGIGEGFGFGRAINAPFSSIEIRVVPENVTNLAKSDPKTGASLVEEREVVLKKGETLETTLRTYGANPDQIQAITSALGSSIKVVALPDGERIRLLIAPGPQLGDARQIVRVVLVGERGIEAIAATTDRGSFVSVTPPSDEIAQNPAKSGDGESDGDDEDEDDGNSNGVRLYESLYETAMKNELPKESVEDLIRIFGYDVDFQRRVTAGDTFEVFYGADDENAAPEILYAALTLGGEERRVYRYQGDDGSVDYFDEQGRSLKKFLLRKPIAEGILRSGFGTRFHPILGYSRPHTGVDWANKVGTPILAAGNGTIIKAGWVSGYGRRVEIQHANGYVTSYNHMSGFGKGIEPGTRVQQGQVVGYLGSTGLSTGPHLHYEVIVNGHFVDPMKIRLPRGRELDGKSLVDFKRQREQIDNLVAKSDSPTNLAQRADLR